MDVRPPKAGNEPAPHLDEPRSSGALVYDGRLLKIYRDEAIAPDGVQCVREFTLHPGAAAIVPLFEDGSLLLERQWRYPLNRSFLEFPAGKLDPGETPLQTAQRELREETGYRANRWAELGPMHPVISYSTEVIHIFLATDLSLGETARDEGEVIDLVRMSVADFFVLVESGQVSDAKTLAAAFWLARIRSGDYRPQWTLSESV
ncbi:MAG: NUDIX hydrolase [Betaproteobacteria bacterium]|nr:NUDIX hydrolase [Betaproteobacteria bacterium]NBT75444.1 NUDIX hydrolase [Betaproteobacteria bacterium]NBY13493.1 NUDIX hydrolase [Betaproteobacteria bacterium]NCA15799.1 NUDIX hydrolase [Betaproteobacteria bacterium]NDF04398.1 NUDIX hydrolase [Betaproteobacteria bacterium]